MHLDQAAWHGVSEPPWDGRVSACGVLMPGWIGGHLFGRRVAKKMGDLLHKVWLIMSVEILKTMGAKFLCQRREFKYGKKSTQVI